MIIQTRRFKWIMQIVSLLILVIVTAILFGFLNSELDLRMQNLKREVFTFLEEQWDREISYESISPSIFMYLEIRDLVIFKDPRREIFRIKRLRISYNIFRLLRGEDPLLAISSLEIANTLLKLDVDDLLAVQGGGNSDEELSLLTQLVNSPYHFTLKGKNVDLDVKFAESTIRLGGLFFSLEDNAGDFSLNLNKARLHFILPQDGGKELRLESNFKLNGILNDNLTYSDLRLHIRSLTSNYFDLGEQTLQVTFADNTLEVRKIQDKAAIDLQVIYLPQTGKIITKFRTVNFYPSELLRLTGSLSAYEPWLKTKLTSSGTVAFVPGTREVDYDITADMFIEKSVLPLEMAVSSHFHGDLRQIVFSDLRVRTNIGSIDFVGNMLFENYFPEGMVKLVNLEPIPGKVINAAFDVIRHSKSISLRGSSLHLGSSGFDLLNADLFPEDDSLRFTLETSLAGYGQDDLLLTEGVFSFKDTTRLEMQGNLFDIPLNAIYKLGVSGDDFTDELYTTLADYQLTASFELATDLKTVSYSSSHFLFEDLAHPSYYLQGAVEGDNHNLSVAGVKAHWQGYTLDGDFGIERKERGRYLFQTHFNFEDVPYSFEGIFTSGRSLLMTGNYDTHLNVIFEDSGEIFFYFLTQHLPLPVGWTERNNLLLSLNLSGILSPDNMLDVQATRVEFYNLPVLTVTENQLHFSCHVDNTGMDLTDVIYNDHISSVTGNGRVDFSRENFPGGKAVLNLTGKQGNETYHFDLNLGEDGNLETEIEFTSSPLERLGDLIVKGATSGTARLSGAAGGNNLYVRFQLEKAKINTDFITLDVEIEFNNEGIRLYSFNFGFLEHRYLNGSGYMNFDEGAFLINGDYKYTFFKKSISSELAFLGRYSALDRNDYLNSLWLNNFQATLSFENILVEETRYNPWTLDLIREGNDLSLKGGPGKAFDLKADLDGNFKLAIEAPFPIQVEASGEVASGQIEATVQNIWIDLEIINLMLGENILAFREGYGIGENLTISGPVNDPDYGGNIRVNDAKLSFFLVPEVTQPFSANLLFLEKTISLTNARADLGGGSILVNGEFEIDHWFPRAFNLRFKSDTTTGLHVVYTFEQLIVDSYVIGEIMTAGDEYDIDVSGDLRAYNCDLQLNNETQEATEDSGDTHLSIDLVFTSGNNVEFHLPSVTFPLVNCYAEQGSEIYLMYKGEDNAFSLKGDIIIKGGEVFYFDRNFFIRSGNIQFNEQGGVFDPRLTVDAEIKEITPEGESVTINLSVLDKRLSEFEPYFSSSPSLSQTEIISILGGAITEKFAAGGLQGLAILGSDILTQFGFFRPIERGVRDALNLDLFTIRMPVVTNIIQEQLGTGTPLVPVESYGLGRYLNNTTITLGQYLSNDIFISGLFRLRDSEILATEDFSSPGFLGLVADVEISLEWVTPILNFEYLFAPKLEHMNEFFIQDNAVKFEWSYSY